MRTALLVALVTLAATEVLAQAPGSMVRSGRELRPPSETVTASRAARAQAQRPDKRSALNARAEQRTVTPAAFNGSWSVAINTRSGPCEPHYRFAVQIINGNLVYDGRPAGRISPSGSISRREVSRPSVRAVLRAIMATEPGADLVQLAIAPARGRLGETDSLYWLTPDVRRKLAWQPGMPSAHLTHTGPNTGIDSSGLTRTE
jgi:hypothetical protein